MSDGVEVNTLSSDPNDSDSNEDGVNDADEDSDGDGLTDGAEVNTHNTDPTNPDTDVSCFEHELATFSPLRVTSNSTCHLTSLRAMV